MKQYPRLELARLDAVPLELRQLTQWVCWVLREDPGRPKPAKLLIDPKTKPFRAGRDASHSDLNTWGSFEEACTFFSKNKRITYQGREVPVCGLGFVFAATDPYTGVDVDDCRNPETGAILPEAQLIIKTLASYTELSPSGTGVHIIVNATLPSGGGRRRNRIEMYSHSRYFTVTGEHLKGTPQEIGGRQSELQDIYDVIFSGDAQVPAQRQVVPEDDPKLIRVRAIPDDELLRKANSAANGAKFVSLWNAEGVVDRSQADAALCALLAYWTRADAERIDRLFRQSSLMRKKWDERRGKDSYGTNTIRFAIRGTVAMYDPDLDATIAEIFNDRANAEIFVQLQGDLFCWDKHQKTWLNWNCNHWLKDSELEALEAAGKVSDELLRRTQARPDPDAKVQAKKLKWALGSGDERRMLSMARCARARLQVQHKLLDADPYLLCCANGVLDLRTGELRDGQRGDYITRTTDYPYVETAVCPTWDKFLSQIMQNDEEMIQYLWRVLGYALTGDITERAFFFLHGEGRNGKSTFVETMMAMLGPSGDGYGQKARFSTFLKKAMQNSVNSDVAHFAGARVIVASEADESAQLDVALVKELTGGDTHRARFLYQGEFEFKPQFKLFLVTNKIPPIRETTYAIWDRLHYIPFEWRVPDEMMDRKLPLRLLGELPGILSKAVKSCLDWQKDGLQPPEKVLYAGKQLYKEMDTIGQFMIECVEQIEDADVKTAHKEVYQIFVQWCKSNGIHKTPSSKWVAAELRNKRFVSERLTDNVLHWRGLKLNASAQYDLLGGSHGREKS